MIYIINNKKYQGDLNEILNNMLGEKVKIISTDNNLITYVTTCNKSEADVTHCISYSIYEKNQVFNMFYVLILFLLSFTLQAQTDTENVILNGKVITMKEFNDFINDPLHDRMLKERKAEVYKKEGYTLNLEYITTKDTLLMGQPVKKVIIKKVYDVAKGSYWITDNYFNTQVVWTDKKGTTHGDRYLITADYEDYGGRVKIWHSKEK